MVVMVVFCIVLTGGVFVIWPLGLDLSLSTLSTAARLLQNHLHQVPSVAAAAEH